MKVCELVPVSQNKTPMKYYFISIGFTKSSEPDNIKCGEDVGKIEAFITADSSVNQESSWQCEFKHFHPGFHLYILEKLLHICTCKFIAA